MCKLDEHKKGSYRGYIAMLAVDKNHRRKKIGENSLFCINAVVILWLRKYFIGLLTVLLLSCIISYNFHWQELILT